MIRTIATALATTTCIVAFATPAAAQTREYDIPAGSLKAVLEAYVRQSGQQVVYRADEVRRVRSPGVRGRHSAEAALAALLSRTGFVTRVDGKLVAIVRRGNEAAAEAVSPEEPTPGNAGAESETAEILVVGSHIRGAPSASTVTTVLREEAKRTGQTDLGQIIRNLPQNFAGGQNPTFAAVGAGGYENTTGSSTLNLRGLGSDASLTLVNGHRVAFDAVSQGIDISAIPLEAIERIDVVADGASALYGSDAVGGVANVTLRRDYSGLFTSARVAAATDGGAVTQQYSAVAGDAWSNGGFMAAAEYQDATEITAAQRSYTDNIAPDGTLIPAQDQFSAVLAGHQAVGEGIEFAFDGNYMHRSTSRCLVAFVMNSCYDSGFKSTSKVDSWSISPRIELALSSTWSAHVTGTYGESRTDIRSSSFSGGAVAYLALPLYKNDLKTFEIGGDGALFALPGGDAKLAAGLGYRANKLKASLSSVAGGIESTSFDVTQKRSVTFIYGEAYLPLISPANNIEFIDRFVVTGALRYEDHRDIDRVTTPKLGFIYSPFDQLDLKGSWGKSFKAPTLYQTGQIRYAVLDAASYFTPPAPGTEPVLTLYGGNPDLKPERATTWALSIEYAPRFIEGLRAEIGYFNIQYNDRVVTPITSSISAFESVYSSLVMLDPGESQVLSELAALSGPFYNSTGGAFDPSAVSAVVYNYMQNTSKEAVEGVDASIRYERDLGENGQINVDGSVTYIESVRELAPGLSSIPRAGVIFTPPNWRGRLSVAWQRDNVSLALTGNYVGSTEDRRLLPAVEVASFTTLDLTAIARSKTDTGILADVELLVGVQNLLDAKPATIRAASPTQVRVDSTNQSLFGRVIGITIAKRW